MKIYTRTGDEGETGLFAGGRVSKGHVRLHAYGSVDELNTILGIVVAVGLNFDEQEAILRVQGELFVVGADLATPLEAEAKWIVRVTPEMVRRLEVEIDSWEAELPVLKNFVLPGGSLAGAYLHLARVVCRRAERWAVMLKEKEQINELVLQYLNRLSDWLFVAARAVNARSGEEERVWRGAV